MKSDLPQIVNADEHRVIYPAGHNIVMYNTEDKGMSFFPGLEGSQGFTCLALSPSKRYLAVAERADRAIIFVYDMHTMRRKKTLTTTDCMSQEYISISFATGQEGKYLVSMGGAPDWILVYWQWERPKVIATIKVSTSAPVYQVSFNIHDVNGGIIATGGNNVFRWYKYKDG
jgi:WD40 repeat protein